MARCFHLCLSVPSHGAKANNIHVSFRRTTGSNDEFGVCAAVGLNWELQAGCVATYSLATPYTTLLRMISIPSKSISGLIGDTLSLTCAIGRPSTNNPSDQASVARSIIMMRCYSCHGPRSSQTGACAMAIILLVHNSPVRRLPRHPSVCHDNHLSCSMFMILPGRAHGAWLNCSSCGE